MTAIASPLRHLVPAGWAGSVDRTLDWYPPTEEVIGLARDRGVRATVLWLGLLATAALIGWLAVRGAGALTTGDRETAAWVVRGGLLVFSLAATLRLWRSDRVYFRGLAATLAGATATVAAWLS